MKIGVIGSGTVGQVLASGFLKHGHEVVIGTRNPSKLAAWAKANPKGHVAGFAEAAGFGEAVVLAVQGSAALDALSAAGAEALADKVVVDATNPIAGAPQKGVLRFFTTLDESLMERLQARLPRARFVKAFSSVGNTRMVNPDFGGVRPTMFICGNDAGAKSTVTEMLDQFGWETEDNGRRRGGARDRAAMHALVHSRFPPEPVDARVQASEMSARATATIHPRAGSFAGVLHFERPDT